MHLFKSFIQDLDTSLSALPDNIELILLGDFNVNFTGSNLNIDKAMKRKLIGHFRITFGLFFKASPGAHLFI